MKDILLLHNYLLNLKYHVVVIINIFLLLLIITTILIYFKNK